MKKYCAEFIGTFVLVLFGCGTAALSGGITGIAGVVAIALAFGLSIVARAYVIGNISGCHINPAVSFAMLISKRMNGKDFLGYVVAQILGAVVAIGVLKLLIMDTAKEITGFGQNGFGEQSFLGTGMWRALIIEIILTFVFGIVVLGVTSTDKMSTVSGIVIGLTLAFVHILGIPLTGTSVNPARSIAPAIFAGGEALSQLWLFIIAPLIGALIAAFVWKFFQIISKYL